MVPRTPALTGILGLLAAHYAWPAGVVDLHCHILPGLDDGAPDLHASLAMAQVAVQNGIQTIAASPHIDRRYGVRPAEIPPRVDALNARLRREQAPLDIVPGGEIALDRLGELRDDDLHPIALGSGMYLLIESPYSRSSPLLEQQIFTMEARGFRPILAHPERSRAFQSDPKLLGRLVRRGALCAVDAGSMSGKFGHPARRLSARMFGEGLVHVVASDAHDPERRPPELISGFAALEHELPGIRRQARWYTEETPAAILAGGTPPRRPRPLRPRRSRFARLTRR